MKTRLLFALALLITSSLAFSQSLVLEFEGETLEPGAEISVEGSASLAEIVVELAVTNSGSATIDVLCQRYELDLVDETTNAFCWGGLCYPPWTGLSAYHNTMTAGQTIDDDFSGHYYPAGYGGISTVAYTFFDMNNPNDSVQVVVMYEGLTVGINEMSPYSQMEVYPNPANGYLKVDLNVAQVEGEVTFQLIDVNGSVVKQTISNNSVVNINTSDLAEGIYLYKAMVGKQIIASEKIVIKH